jgi:hypothetical protein
MGPDNELDVFKREIDLRQFAVSLGYQMDRRESWRGSAVLRSGGDKIVVKRNGNGHYVFFSVRDDNDNGTVIDFLQWRQNLSLGAVRQILRPWIGRPSILPQFSKLEPTSPDRMHVEREFRRMFEAPGHPYLEQKRCLPGILLSSSRFAGRGADRSLRQCRISPFRPRRIVRLRNQKPRIYRLCGWRKKGSVVFAYRTE